MIKYNLNCKNCANEFDSWFSNSKEFDRLKKLKLLNCQNCKSTNIEKSLMSPNLLNTKKDTKFITNKKIKKIKNKIKEYQQFIKKNFHYVGDNFTYEARSIHYNNKNEKKGIYGNATLDDVKELKEEGIEIETIPWINDNEN